jgi:hypothetical protein
VTGLRAELRHLATWGERHRRLLSRLTIILVLTLIIDAVGSVAMYALERDTQGTDIRSLGDAVFFTTVQLLTVSSQLRNPLTTGGRVVDVVLEAWGVLVVASSAGAVAAFFQSDNA